ncbi:MAG: hypothetical protein CL678_03255 [Bdellovibrionaceae bacterium]|nr:hypothetical protein [Pseudobdellovibrionaceae bacterium]|tara:strand:+ start:4258 stop:4632 length:375 start_codon:yes stop_codon:yes gene_type:complete
MLSYSVYKVIHLTGVFMVVMALGGAVMAALSEKEGRHPGRKWIGMTHGMGLVIALFGGFGLLARIEIHWPWPLWVWLKMALWLLLGGFIAMIYKKAQAHPILWWVVLVLPIIGAILAQSKIGSM